MNQDSVYIEIMKFKHKYPGTTTWHRLKQHSKVVQEHLNPGEKVLYAFAGQKNEHWYDFFQTCVVVLTSKRILIGQKRVVFGYFLKAITPDMFNDLSVYKGLFWGRIEIDTVKEQVFISNLDKKSLDEIETNISEYMMEEKKKYHPRETYKEN